MFTIYQIHKISGEYEDYLDAIIGSYLHKERAERELEKLNDELNERHSYYQKCLNCSAQFGCSASEVGKIRESCDYFETEEEEPLVGFCKNAVYSYENTYYEMKEVEVEE